MKSYSPWDAVFPDWMWAIVYRIFWIIGEIECWITAWNISGTVMEQWRDCRGCLDKVEEWGQVINRLCSIQENIERKFLKEIHFWSLLLASREGDQAGGLKPKPEAPPRPESAWRQVHMDSCRRNVDCLYMKSFGMLMGGPVWGMKLFFGRERGGRGL